MADHLPQTQSQPHPHSHHQLHPHHHEEEEDVCRVCRVEGDEADPLIHPCKCSGSVRYVHPDCLKQWLAQTGKKHCEICGHKYAFTKIYPEQLPSSIPLSVVIRQTLWWIGRQQLWVARICLVVVTWLIVLPSMNMFSLRTILWLTDHIGHQAPSSPIATSLSSNKTLSSVTTSIVNGTTRITSSSSANGTASVVVNITRNALGNVTEGGAKAEDASLTIVEYLKIVFEKCVKGDENSAVTYVLRGQILSLSLAAVLFGLILLREWITQHTWQEHARPQIVEEGEINPDEWIVMNGIARKTSEVVTALMRVKRQARAARGYQRAGSPDRDGASFVALAQEQRESRLARTQGSLDAIRQNLERAKQRAAEGIESDADAVASLEEQENQLEQKIMRHAVLTEALSSRGPNPNDPWRPEQTEATAFGDALEEYRTSHRMAERRMEEFTKIHQRAQAEGDLAKSALAETQLDGLLDELDEIREGNNEVEDPELAEEDGGEPEAGPSRPRLERVGTGLEDGDLGTSASVPMDVRSDSKRSQKEPDGVAYTAPELLTKKGKGKAEGEGEVTDEGGSADQDGLARSGDGSWTIHEDIPLFLHASPARTASSHSTASVVPSPDRTAGDLDLGLPRDDVEPVLRQVRAGTPVPWAQEDDLTDFEDGEADGDGDDGEWEDEPDADAGDPIAELREIVENVPGADGQGEIRPVEVAFVDELDEEPWDGDDWNGVLEVIGLIGPLHGLLQNVLFGTIILGASVSLFVGVPMLIGKVALSIDLIRLGLSVSARTLHLIRKVTDPIVDIVFEIVKEVVVLPLLSSVGAAEKIIAAILGLEGTGPSAELLHRFTSLLPIPDVSSSTGVSEQGKLTLLGDGLAWLGQHAYDGYASYIDAKHAIAASTAVADRVWCTLTGYAVAGGIVVLVAVAGEAGGGMSREFARSLKEHSMFFKLAFFMILELGAFPLGLGLMIDACTVPLWPGATLLSRVERLSTSPFGTMFVDWLIGTMFMYQFAGLLSHIRTLCRPGTLFFIRDPADPNYSPVKDIVEKSGWSQLRKLSTSAVMYSVVVFTLFGVASWTLAYLPFVKLFPLRIDQTFGPLTSIPFDLLFLHLVVPPTQSFIRPRHRLRVVLTLWWRHTIKLFHLTALMAPRRASADSTRSFASLKLEKVWPVLDPICQIMFGGYDPQTTRARVPASDQVILLPPLQRKAEGGVFIPLTDEGSPLNPQDKLRLLKQDKRAREAGRDPRRDYEVITLPAYWRTRIHAFIGATLVMGALVIATAALGPLVVGRMALGWDRGKGLHDGYAWLAGAYIIYLSLSLGLSARRFILSTSKAARLRRSGRSTRIKRTAMRCLAGAYGLTMVYGLVPIMVGLLYEVYGGALAVRKGRTIVHFWDTWAMGTVICSLGVGLTTSVARFRPTPGRAILLESLTERFNDPAPRDFGTTNAVVLPTIGYLSIPLFAPFFVAFLAALATGRRYGDEVYHGLFLAVIPLLLRVFGAAILRQYLSAGWGNMRQKMIDAEYVVEERVENYVPDQSQPQPQPQSQAQAQARSQHEAGIEAMEQALELQRQMPHDDVREIAERIWQRRERERPERGRGRADEGDWVDEDGDGDGDGQDADEVEEVE